VTESSLSSLSISFHSFFHYSFQIIQNYNYSFSGALGIVACSIRGCIQKFPDWVDNEVNDNNSKHLRSITRVMVAKLSRLTHKIVVQLHLVAESCTIYSSRSRQPVWKLLDTPSYTPPPNTAAISNCRLQNCNLCLIFPFLVLCVASLAVCCVLAGDFEVSSKTC
jgi:hypothetical protein